MKRHCIGGLKKSTHKSTHKSLRKKFTNHTIYSLDDLPPKVDLRPWMTPVEDQSDLNSCTANAIAGIYEYLIKKSTNKHVDVSRLFIYYNARKKDKEIDSVPPIITDDGATVTSTIETLKEVGVCLESNWPYKKRSVNLQPPLTNYKEAKEHTIVEALQIPVNLYYMKSCLAQGFPFLFGIELYASFDKAGSNGGVVPIPKSSMAARASHGSHAMLAVGYSEASQAFIIRNSWGEDWGDNGYCYIPYEYMTNSDLCSDLWTVKHIATDTLGKEQWVIQDTINYLAHNYALAPNYYTDDQVGLNIEQVVVRERYYLPSYQGGYNETFIANNAAPPIQNYIERPTQDDAAPPTERYTERPIQNDAERTTRTDEAHPAPDYAGRPTENDGARPAPDDAARSTANDRARRVPDYAARPAPDYAARPAPDDAARSTLNDGARLTPNYAAPPYANYVPPPFANYPAPPFLNYPAFSIPNYVAPPYANYPAFPRPNYVVPPYANYAPPPFANYPAPPYANFPAFPRSNYVVPSYANYVPSPFANYRALPSANYPAFPIPNYVAPSIIPYDPPRHRRPAYPSNPPQNYDRPRSLWRRIFLKP